MCPVATARNHTQRVHLCCAGGQHPRRNPEACSSRTGTTGVLWLFIDVTCSVPVGLLPVAVWALPRLSANMVLLKQFTANSWVAKSLPGW